MAQLEGGRLPLEPGDADLSAVVAQAVEAARPRAADRGIALELGLDSALACHGDADRLGQALDNLISNALKYTAAGGNVDVRARRRGERALIEVADTGVGIPGTCFRVELPLRAPVAARAPRRAVFSG
jgi:signal transduction histidine kinase